MSYSRRQLYAMGEPIGDSATYRKADGGLILGGGGSSSGSGNSTSTNTNLTELPEWARGYAKDTLYQASQLTDINRNPYQTYNQNRIAGFSPLQEQAQQGAANMRPDASLGTGMDMAQAAGIGALGTSYQGSQYGNQFQAPGAYQAGQFGNQFQAPQNLGYTAQDARNTSLGAAPTVERQTTYGAPGMNAATTAYDPRLQNYQMGPARDVTSSNYMTPEMRAAQSGYNPQLQTFQMGPAERVDAQGVNVEDINAAQMGPAERISTQSFAQPGSADAYMSPYMQNVVDVQKREAARQSGIQGTQQQAQAAQAGAFGGGRDAIMRAERERNLGQQMGDIQAQGSQAAFQNAQQQFNTEQQARLAAQQANQQAGITVGGQNLNAQQQTNVQNAANRLQARGMSADSAMKAALANQQAGLSVGQQNLASQIGTQQLGAGQIGLQTSLANLSNAQQQQVQNQAAQLQNQGMSAQQAMQAALANQQKDLSMGQQNLAANLGVQQLGAQTGTQVALANLSNQQQQQVQNQAAQLQTQGMNAQQALQIALANQSTQSQYGLTQGQLSQQTNLANQNAQNQALQFGAGQGLQAAGMGAQYGLSGQQLGEQSRQYGAGQGLQAAGMSAQYGQGANQLNEQSKQYGAGIGLQGLQTGLQAAGQMGQLGQAQFGQQMGINQLQNQYGGQQQAQAQQGLSQGYQDFLNQQNYPYKQIGFMSDLIRGLPLGQQSTAQMYQAPPSAMQNIAAAGMGAYGLSKLMANGGQVKGYAYGGELNPMDDLNRMTAAVSKLTDEQLQKVIQRPSSAAQKQAAQLELATRASEKKGLASAYNAMPMAAAGGVVAFGRGGIMHFVEGGGTNINPVDPFAVDRDYAETDEALDDANDDTGSGSVGDAALHRRAVEKGLNVLNTKIPVPAQVDINDSKLGAKSYMDTMRNLAGPDPYADATAQVSDIAEKSKAALEQGKGIAALSAMGAILQGPNFMRALGGAGAAFADSYKGALAANQVAATEAAKMKINIATGKRAETLGLAKDAISSFQSARANETAMYKAQSEALRNTATAAARLATATRPPKAGAAAKPSVYQLGLDIYGAQLKAEHPDWSKEKIAAEALKLTQERSAAGLPGVQAAVTGRSAIAGGAQSIDTDRLRTDAATKAAVNIDKGLLLNPEYRAAIRGKDPKGRTTAQVRDDLVEAETQRILKDTKLTSAATPAAPGTRIRFDEQGNQVQ